jgi:antirestriction protein ArdC
MENANFSQLLVDAVTQEGVLSAAYEAFHDYSIGNQMLAYTQCRARQMPIGAMATFNDWQKLGRTVKKGEKAIALVQPVTVARKDAAGNKTDEVFTLFTLKNRWFVMSQTEGQDVASEPVVPQWDKAKALEALNITEIDFQMADGNCQGYAKGSEIAINPVAALPHKTRFHEMAHVVLGHTKESRMDDSETTTRDIREVEAESVAYILCSLLNLEGLAECRGYIQHWLGSNKIEDKSAQKIFAAANKILAAGQ